MKRPVKIFLKRTGDNYVVTQIRNAVTFSISTHQPNQRIAIRVGNTLIEREAEEVASQYEVTVR